MRRLCNPGRVEPQDPARCTVTFECLTLGRMYDMSASEFSYPTARYPVSMAPFQRPSTAWPQQETMPFCRPQGGGIFGETAGEIESAPLVGQNAPSGPRSPLCCLKPVEPGKLPFAYRKYKPLRLRGMGYTGLPGSYESRLVTKSGEMKHVILAVSLIPGSELRICSMIDITNRKTMKE